MLEKMNKEWFEQLDKWVSMLQEGENESVIEEMHDLICGYEQS
ncbi:hypothetical protein [Paenibacillus sinopodophylli]|nr:hypothetical protein [Paenibacillus sinopodophylli]